MPSETRNRASDGICYSGLQKSGQGDEAADSTNSTARRGNAVLV
ncbi:hypothetical protein [Neisseria meningitidis]|nr:hypothetical protein [Neisseria meningitidis]